MKQRTIAARAERIVTLHPGGRRGVNIERCKYDAMRRAILRGVPRSVSGVALSVLAERIDAALDAVLFGPGVGRTWYLIAVKQDLQARGLIELVPGAKPQRLRRPRRDEGR